MAITRLRKTFKYPDEDDVPEAMDEEEQEKLIAKLTKDNSERNVEWTRVFLGLTITSMGLFIPCFLRSISKKPPYHIGFMGITSLLATAYNLVLIPTKQTSPGTGGEGARKLELQLTPLQRYVPHLNLALTLLIAWTGASMKDNREVFDTFWVICQVPLIMYGIIFVVKRFIIEVDPEELEQMKYVWKGA